MTTLNGTLLLSGIFRALRAAGIPLSIRNYLDGVWALTYYQEPFVALKGVQPTASDADFVTGGVRDTPLHRIKLRKELVWLCETLWARSEDERKVIRDTITRTIGLPPAQWTEKLLQLGRDALVNTHSPDLPPTSPIRQKEIEEEKKRQDRIRRGQNEEMQEGEKKVSKGGGTKKGGDTNIVGCEKPISRPVEFADDGDMSIPDLRDIPIFKGREFVLSSTQLVSPLWLTALWRRLFVPIRRPDLRDIDPAETVRMAARVGCILRPSMRMMRVNDAKLLVLIDVGYGMAPWFDFINSLVKSLEINKGRAGTISTAFFTGAPGDRVYVSRDLSKPVRLSNLLREMSSSPVLIFGQAGVLGTPQLDLSKRIDTFFLELAESGLKPLVWINPMPRKRWLAGEMPRIIKKQNTTAFELNAESLLRAVDVLRGII